MELHDSASGRTFMRSRAATRLAEDIRALEDTPVPGVVAVKVRQCLPRVSLTGTFKSSRSDVEIGGELADSKQRVIYEGYGRKTSSMRADDTVNRAPQSRRSKLQSFCFALISIVVF